MLNKAALKAALKACFENVSENKTSDDAAEEMANAIDAYVKSATVLPGTFSNTGGPVVGSGILQ